MTRPSLRLNTSQRLRSGSSRLRPSLRTLYRSLGAGLLGLGLMMVMGAGPAEARGDEKSQAVRCTKAISKSLERMHNRLARDSHRRCIAKHQRGTLTGTLESCLLGDPVGALARVSYDPRSRIEKICSGAPEFLQPDLEAFEAIAFQTTGKFLRDILGPDFDEGVTTWKEGRREARCHRVATRNGQRCNRARHRTFRRCASRGIETAEDLEACVTAATSMSCWRVERQVERYCDDPTSTARAVATTPQSQLAGCDSSTSSCHQTASSCLHCLQMAAAMPSLHPNCDEMDDQTLNGSCVAPSCSETLAPGSSTLADGGVLQMNCPYLPNTTPWNNRRDATREDQSHGYGMTHFAWNSFMALNWPAKGPSRHGRPASAVSSLPTRGIPDTTKSFKKARPTDLAVWETFKEKREVFHRGRCEAPVYNYSHLADMTQPEFLFVGCSDDVDCAHSATGYHFNTQRTDPGGQTVTVIEASSHLPFTQQEVTEHDVKKRARTNLGKCLLDRPPVRGVCDGHPTQGCSANLPNLLGPNQQGSPECPGHAACLLFSTTHTPLHRGTNVCSKNGHTEVKKCYASTQICETDKDCRTTGGLCSGSNPHMCQSDSDCFQATCTKCRSGGTKCTSDNQCQSHDPRAPFCIYDGSSSLVHTDPASGPPLVKSGVDKNPAPTRSVPSLQWGGFPQYTPQGAIGQKPIEACPGHEAAVAQMGHETHLASPRKFNSLDETVEVHSEARESFTELCQGTKWCQDLAHGAWRGACQSDIDCANSGQRCVAVTNPEETCAGATALSRQVKRVCSLDTSVQCGVGAPCGDDGECILVQDRPNTFHAPPCCRAKGNYVAPRVWKGDPAAHKVCKNTRHACNTNADCPGSHQCETTSESGRAIYFEVKVNYDYFNYITKSLTAFSAVAPELYLNSGLGASAYYGGFQLPSRTSLDRSLASTLPFVANDLNPQRALPRQNVHSYNAATCLNDHGHERRCSNQLSKACHSNTDCTGNGQCTEPAHDATPCRTGSVQVKAAWHKLRGVCKHDSSITCELDSTCNHGSGNNGVCDFSRDGDPNGRLYKTRKAIYHKPHDVPPPADKNERVPTPSKETICKAVGAFGLVGFHIIQRTHQDYLGSSIPSGSEYSEIGNNFIFATWEHKGNYDVCSNDAERYCHTDQDCSQGGACLSAGYRYANHYEGIAENRAYDEGFTPSADVPDTALPLKRLARHSTLATKTVNAEVHRALGCPTGPSGNHSGNHSVWCDYRLVGIQYIATDPDGSFAGNDINGSAEKMCYEPGMNYSQVCTMDSDCGTGGHGFGTCIPVPQGDGDQDYLLANLVIESNLDLQYFKGLPPKIAPSRKRTAQYRAADGHCQSDPRIACTGGLCSNSDSQPCYVDDDCSGGTCTKTCTDSGAPIQSVCLQNHEYRCAYNLQTKCSFPGVPLPSSLGADETCGFRLAAYDSGPGTQQNEINLHNACSNGTFQTSPRGIRAKDCTDNSGCRVCQHDSNYACTHDNDCAAHSGGACQLKTGSCQHDSNYACNADSECAQNGGGTCQKKTGLCENNQAQSCTVASDCHDHGGGGCDINFCDVSQESAPLVAGAEITVPTRASTGVGTTTPFTTTITSIRQHHGRDQLIINPPVPNDRSVSAGNFNRVEVTPINPFCIAVPKPCVNDFECRSDGISGRFEDDICLNHCAPPNSNTLFPLATVCSDHPQKTCGNDDDCGAGAQCIGRSVSVAPNPTTYQFPIDPRAGIPYGRTKPNVFYDDHPKNMGGCMGCHGVADTLGFEFSFVAKDGQTGVQIQTDNDNPSFGAFESFRSRRSSVR